MSKEDLNTAAPMFYTIYLITIIQFVLFAVLYVTSSFTYVQALSLILIFISILLWIIAIRSSVIKGDDKTLTKLFGNYFLVPLLIQSAITGFFIGVGIIAERMYAQVSSGVIVTLMLMFVILHWSISTQVEQIERLVTLRLIFILFFIIDILTLFLGLAGLSNVHIFASLFAIMLFFMTIIIFLFITLMREVRSIKLRAISQNQQS
ncbi:hypothetical protein VMUT_2233 [Vulcanisaeta moutnovskia 768-28]|uniref:Uncharacterized protein n=1 Tax=Vulcanisaeta moutnovskia (strain 768-28) TaxID=985053 RepID=F0QXL4_VULM7|nr:hypothetical protein [Vulcanisaeta moutnovskia]ADY02429.1 hypothetical protein VMUT_2233 [Vulcanisaeta moutnovskia 768-28]